MAHLCVVLDQGSAGHSPSVVAGCHNQRHVGPCLCHADSQLYSSLGGWGGGKAVRNDPGDTHGPCTAHVGTHIRSLSQPAAGGPWEEPGAHISPRPAAQEVPGRGTPHWSLAPPALKHKHGKDCLDTEEGCLWDSHSCPPHTSLSGGYYTPGAAQCPLPWARRLLQVPQKSLGSLTKGLCGCAPPRWQCPPSLH